MIIVSIQRKDLRMSASKVATLSFALLAAGGCASFDFPWSTPPGEYTRGAASDHQRQADVEACHDVAQAQIKHDQRVQQDINAARDIPDRGLGVQEFESRMRSYGERSRFETLFGSCMRGKGYLPE